MNVHCAGFDARQVSLHILEGGIGSRGNRRQDEDKEQVIFIAREAADLTKIVDVREARLHGIRNTDQKKLAISLVQEALAECLRGLRPEQPDDVASIVDVISAGPQRVAIFIGNIESCERAVDVADAAIPERLDRASSLAAMVIIDGIGEAIGAIEPFRGRIGQGPFVVQNASPLSPWVTSATSSWSPSGSESLASTSMVTGTSRMVVAV